MQKLSLKLRFVDYIEPNELAFYYSNTVRKHKCFLEGKENWAKWKSVDEKLEMFDANFHQVCLLL